MYQPNRPTHRKAAVTLAPAHCHICFLDVLCATSLAAVATACARSALAASADAQVPITASLADLGEICKAAMDDASAAHPECKFDLKLSGDLIGDFDRPRLQQVFSNLLNNGAQYRAREHPVTIIAHDEGDMVIVQVKNLGPEISAQSMQAMFDPMVQLAVHGSQPGRPATSLGLGLFIAREITVAHGGTIQVESDEGAGTVFTVRLPRTQPALL